MNGWLRSNRPSFCCFSMMTFCCSVDLRDGIHTEQENLGGISMLSSATRKRDGISLFWPLPGITGIHVSIDKVSARSISRKTSSVSTWQRRRVESRSEAVAAVPLTLSLIILDVLKF